jgi:hypothetical protein
MRPSPPLREIEIPVEPMSLSDLSWEGGIARGTGDHPFLIFGLPKPELVFAICLTISYNGTDGPLPLAVYWKNENQEELTGDQVFEKTMTLNESIQDPDTQAGTKRLVVPVNAPIQRFCVVPQVRPAVFKILAITLRVPTNGPSSLVPVYRLGSRIDFTKVSSQAYLGHGWHEREDWGRWSGSKAALHFRLERGQPLRLRMMAQTFGKQKVIVGLNGRDLKTLDGLEEARRVELDIPAEAVAEDNLLTFTLPDARSPKSTDESGDPRVLGLGVIWVEFAPAPEGDQ